MRIDAGMAMRALSANNFSRFLAEGCFAAADERAAVFERDVVEVACFWFLVFDCCLELGDCLFLFLGLDLLRLLLPPISGTSLLLDLPFVLVLERASTLGDSFGRTLLVVAVAVVFRCASWLDFVSRTRVDCGLEASMWPLARLLDGPSLLPSALRPVLLLLVLALPLLLLRRGGDGGGGGGGGGLLRSTI